MIVRRALAADLPVLAPLFDRYRQFYGQPADLERARAFMAERIELNESVVFLASHGGEAIGFVQLYPGFSSVRAARTFALNDLYVAGDRRRGGVGRALVEAAVEHAREAGAVGLSLVTGADNRRAQALYEGLGWARETAFVEYGLSLEAETKNAAPVSRGGADLAQG